MSATQAMVLLPLKKRLTKIRALLYSVIKLLGQINNLIKLMKFIGN